MPWEQASMFAVGVGGVLVDAYERLAEADSRRMARGLEAERDKGPRGSFRGSSHAGRSGLDRVVSRVLSASRSRSEWRASWPIEVDARVSADGESRVVGQELWTTEDGTVPRTGLLADAYGRVEIGTWHPQ